MTISVVMAAYNAERYIAAALDSILAQTRKPDEIIVVDDGSTDATQTVLQSYKHNILQINLSHVGGSQAFNAGISAANGEFLAFLDADDLWEKEKLRNQCILLEKDFSLDAVFGHVAQFISEDVPLEIGRQFFIPPPMPGISKNAMLVRRTSFLRVGIFDAHASVSEFTIWYARASAMGFRVQIEPEIVALRRLHEANTGRLKRGEQQQETLLGLKQSLDLRRKKRP